MPVPMHVLFACKNDGACCVQHVLSVCFREETDLKVLPQTWQLLRIFPTSRVHHPRREICCNKRRKENEESDSEIE